jgi:predicted nucleic acid-binding protein
MSSEVFVDANVLLYSLFPDSEWHVQARAKLAELEGSGRAIVACAQILREVSAVLTRDAPRGRGLSGATAAGLVSALSDRLTLVSETAASHARWLDFLERGLARGAQVHDANIAAIMVASGIPTLLTHNVRDFERFASWIHIMALEPSIS